MKILCFLILLSIIFFGCKKGSDKPENPVINKASITTSEISSLLSKTAFGGGNISSDGGAPITIRGLCWSTNSNPLLTDNHTSDGSGTGVFSNTITGLNPSTSYYARAYATNSSGTAYGNEIKFTTPAHDVYAAGYEYDGTYNQAKVWINGVGTSLKNSFNGDSWATDVFVDGTDVYASGYAYNGKHNTAMLWKNGAGTQLSSITYNAEASSVFIFKGDVYVGGFQENSDEVLVAKIWKNGIERVLSRGVYDAQVSGLFVNDNDVYAAGDGTDEAKIWTNSGTSYLNQQTSAAYSVCASGNDVYAAGMHIVGTPKIKMWKNGVGTFLSDTYTMDIAYDITIAGGDIYIAGFSQNSGIATADLWKNGMITHLTNGTNYARAYSVAVADKDVYVAGYETVRSKDMAKTWMNGTLIYSTNGVNHARIRSLFVR